MGYAARVSLQCLERGGSFQKTLNVVENESDSWFSRMEMQEFRLEILKGI